MNGTHCDHDWHRLITRWARKIKCIALARDHLSTFSYTRRLHNIAYQALTRQPLCPNHRQYTHTSHSQAKLNYIARVSIIARIESMTWRRCVDVCCTAVQPGSVVPMTSFVARKTHYTTLLATTFIQINEIIFFLLFFPSSLFSHGK